MCRPRPDNLVFPANYGWQSCKRPVFSLRHGANVQKWLSLRPEMNLLAILVSVLAIVSASSIIEGATEVPPEFLVAASDDVVRLAGQYAQHWRQGVDEVFCFTAPMSVSQGHVQFHASAAVVWMRPTVEAGTAVDVFAEKGTRLVIDKQEVPTGSFAYLRFETRRGVVLAISALSRQQEEAPAENVLWQRASRVRRGESPEGPPLPEEEALFLGGDIKWSAEAARRQMDGPLDRLTLRGNVAVELIARRVRIFADTIVLWAEHTRAEGGSKVRLRDLYAEGSVVLLGDQETLYAERLYLDAITNEGEATGARVQLRDPKTGLTVVFAAPSVRQLSPDIFLAPTGYVTSCDFAHPHYRIQGHDIRLVRGSPHFESVAAQEAKGRAAVAKDLKSSFEAESQVVSSRHNVFWLGPVPVAYLPYVSRDIKTGGYLVTDVNLGSSREFGFYVHTGWNLYDLGLYRNDWSDLTLHLDYYARRGTAAGIDFAYEGTSRFGFIKTYGIRDHAETDGGDIPIPKDDRGRVLWRHREFLPADWRADLEFAWRSDPNFLREFFRDEFEEAKEEETLVYLRKAEANRLYTVLAKTRANSFDTVVERIPEIAFTQIAQPYYGGHLLWSSRASLAQLRRKWNDLLDLEDPDAVTRLDSTNELSAPLWLGPAQLEPFLSLEMTGFSETADESGSQGRFLAGYGLRAGLPLSRTYELRVPWLEIDRVRHIMTPTVDYRRVAYLSESPERFIRFDEIDARDYEHRIVFGLRNRWQTKRTPPPRTPAELHPLWAEPLIPPTPVSELMRSVDFVLLDLEYEVNPGRRGANAGADDCVGVDFLWRVNQHWLVSSWGNKYNMHRNRWQQADGKVECTYFPPFTLAYRHTYLNPSNAEASSVGRLSVAYEPKAGRWRLELEESYDFLGRQVDTEGNRRRNLGTTLAVQRAFHDWLLIVGAEFFKGPERGAELNFRVRPVNYRGERVKI